eukprot:jgi/Mesvir1/28096/Mv04683-RA.1
MVLPWRDCILSFQCITYYYHKLQCCLQIILGSASGTRQMILREMGYDFEIQCANIDEKAIRHDSPEQLVVALGYAKAEAIRAQRQAAGADDSIVADPHAPTLLITGDQVVVHEGQILEKPESPEEARRFISGYARSLACTVGSVVVTNLVTGKAYHGVDRAEIYFHDIPAAVIEAVIEEGSVYKCAGGLMVEHPLVSPLVASMVGDIDSVLGLSKRLTTSLIQKALAP